MANRSIPQELAHLLRVDPARPLITQIWADGQRAELSARTFENNVAKAANLLQDEVEAQEDTTILIALPLHWQTSVWLTAAALTGSQACVLTDGMALPDVHFSAAFVDRSHAHITSACPVYGVSLHPLGLPEADTPGIDLAREVRAYSDVFSPYTAPQPGTSWLHLADGELSQTQALDAAAHVAESTGLGTDGRLLIHGEMNRRSILSLAAVPLATRSSLVICSDPDADIDQIMTTERCTAVLAT